MRIDIYHHIVNELGDKKLNEILQKLNLLISKETIIMADLSELQAKVEKNGEVEASAVALLQGLKAALDAAGTDPVKLKELSDSLGAQTDDLAAAIVANTPAQP